MNFYREKSPRFFTEKKTGWFYQEKNDQKQSPRFFYREKSPSFLPRKIIEIFNQEKLWKNSKRFRTKTFSRLISIK